MSVPRYPTLEMLRAGQDAWSAVAAESRFPTSAGIERFWQAMYDAAPKDPRGEVTVTTDYSGAVVAVMRTDEEHRVLSVIWPKNL